MQSSGLNHLAFQQTSPLVQCTQNLTAVQQNYPIQKLNAEQSNGLITLIDKTNMKRKTNEQKLRSIMKNLHTIEIALLVERIETMMKLTLQDIEEDPSKWDNFFVSHHAYVNMANKVLEELK